MKIRYHLLEKWSLSFLLGAGLSGAAYADTVNPFDLEQGKRLAAVQNAIKNKTAPKEAAQTQLTEVSDQLKDYGQFGPNQVKVAVQLASTKVTKDIIDYISAASEGGEIGYDVSAVTKEKLEKDYGIELKHDDNKKVWKAALSGATAAEKQKSFERFKSAVGAKLDSSLWKSLDGEAQTIFTNTTLSRLGTDLQEVIKDDVQVTETLRTELTNRSRALGGKDSGRIGELEEKLSVAKKDDAAEEGMLKAEKKTYEQLNNATEQSLEDFCKELASNLTADRSALMVQRRLAATNSDDPCNSPLKTAAAAVPEASRAIAAGASGTDTGKVTSFSGSGDKDETEETREDRRRRSLFSGARRERSEDDYKDLPADQRRLAKERDEALDQVDELAAKIQDVQGQVDQANRNNALLACNKAFGGGKDPLNLTSDTALNEKIISTINDKLEKTLAKGYQGLVCEKSGAKDGPVSYSAMQEAAREVLKGMGIPRTGALTESKSSSLEGISKSALEVANNFTNQTRLRGKLNYQLQEAASKKALSRIAIENTGLIDLNSLQYLRSLSYRELTGVETNADGVPVSISGGALALFLPADSRAAAIQVFDNYYQTALLEQKEKNGIGEDFDAQAQCAMALAQEATDRWASEEDRKGLLGLRGSGAARKLAVYNPTEVRNVKSTKKAKSR